MVAKKSANRMNVKINQNFVIRVLVNPKTNKPANRRLSTANQLLSYIDEPTRAKLFDKVMTQGKFKYSFTLEQVRVEFHSK